MRMPYAQHSLHQRKRLPVHLLGLLVLPLATEHDREVVHAGEGVGMLAAQRLTYVLSA